MTLKKKLINQQFGQQLATIKSSANLDTTGTLSLRADMQLFPILFFKNSHACVSADVHLIIDWYLLCLAWVS